MRILASNNYTISFIIKIMNNTQEFIQLLQSSITPVAMISGVGLLLLTITNRLGRTIDRVRQLVSELDKEDVKRRKEKEDEVRILFKRSRYLRNSIASIVISAMTSSLIIPVLFFMTQMDVDLRVIGQLLFIISIFSILVSSIYFFLDVLLSLKALKLEIKEYH
jgi:hypothetical protein